MIAATPTLAVIAISWMTRTSISEKVRELLRALYVRQDMSLKIA